MTAKLEDNIMSINCCLVGIYYESLNFEFAISNALAKVYASTQFGSIVVFSVYLVVDIVYYEFVFYV